MTRDEMIQTVRTEHETASEAGYGYDMRRAEDAINEGLVEGDRVHLGGTLIAHVLAGDEVSMIDGETETTRLSLSDLTPQQRDRMLVLKAVRRSLKGWSIGCA